jgi:hypothetical protein
MTIPSDLDSLDDLALRAGADIRLPLLRALVDLYLQKRSHTDEEERHFTELTLRLLDEADVPARLAVAQRLASYPSVPAAISRRLAENVPGRAVPPAPDVSIQSTATATELSELFFSASAAERRMILVNLAYAPATAAPLHHSSEAAHQLEAAALARNPDAFMRALERWLGVGPALARRIVLDPLGEPIVVAAKVLGIATDALQRILLFVNPAVGRSVYRVFELAMLFETIQAQAALALVGIWRAADPPSADRPAPVQIDSDAGPRRTAAPRAAGTQRNAGGGSPRAAAGKR